jgi:transposase-like protein
MTIPDHLFDLPRWTEDDARHVIAALERSGQPVSTFAAEHDIDPQRLYVWRRRLGSAEHATFRELEVRRSPHHFEPATPFELVLTSGMVLRIPASFDSASLARVLEVLSQC